MSAEVKSQAIEHMKWTLQSRYNSRSHLIWQDSM